jgi:hypothetical protein
MKSAVLKAAGIALLLAGFGAFLLAFPAGVPTPEIDAASAGNALALLGGAVLLIRSRKK